MNALIRGRARLGKEWPGSMTNIVEQWGNRDLAGAKSRFPHMEGRAMSTIAQRCSCGEYVGVKIPAKCPTCEGPLLSPDAKDIAISVLKGDVVSARREGMEMAAKIVDGWIDSQLLAPLAAAIRAAKEKLC